MKSIEWSPNTTDLIVAILINGKDISLFDDAIIEILSNELCLLNLSTGNVDRLWPTFEEMRTVSWNPRQANIIALGCIDGTIAEIDVTTRTILNKLVKLEASSIVSEIRWNLGEPLILAKSFPSEEASEAELTLHALDSQEQIMSFEK